MTLRFAFRRYALPFRAPVRTAHGPWVQREGLLVRLESDAGRVGWGEAAPIPWFGSETVDHAMDVAAQVGEWSDGERLGQLPDSVPCLRGAVQAALAEVQSGEPAPAADAPAHLAVAALLPAGKPALAALLARAESGFRSFKWKVGVGDPADELGILDDLLAQLPPKGRLRLDANGAWDRRQATRWLERCAERPIEFIEQPCLADPRDGPAAARRNDDLLLGLANDFPTTLALDESVASDADVERWLAAGWPGVFVMKTALLATPDRTLARLEKAQARVVFSSALETAVGARTALRRAFAWKGERYALGFGVWPLFADESFDGPTVAPFLRATDVERLSPTTCWEALA